MADQQSVQLAEEIHRASKMGMQASQAVMTKTADEKLQYDLNQQFSVYRGIADRSGGILPHDRNKPEDGKVVWGAVELHALPDSSPTRIAEILINGCTMNIVEITKKINENETADLNVKSLAKELIEADQNTIETLKKYL